MRVVCALDRVRSGGVNGYGGILCVFYLVSFLFNQVMMFLLRAACEGREKIAKVDLPDCLAIVKCRHDHARNGELSKVLIV